MKRKSSSQEAARTDLQGAAYGDLDLLQTTTSRLAPLAAGTGRNDTSLIPTQREGGSEGGEGGERGEGGDEKAIDRCDR